MVSILDSTERITFQLKTVMDFVKAKPKNISSHSLTSLFDEAIQTTPIPDEVKINVPKTGNKDAKLEKRQSSRINHF